MYGRRQPRGVRAGELHGGEQVHSGASSFWQRAEVGADHPDRDGPAFFCGKCAGCPVREAGFFAGGASSARSQVGTAQAVRFP